MRDALLEAGYRVTVVAPAENQSASSMRMNLYDPMLCEPARDGVWAVSGSPADAVQIGLLHLLLDDPPDLVVSGSNRGENVGFSTRISGTLGAATIAMLRGFPAIAVSVEIRPSERDAQPVAYPSTVTAYTGAAEFTAALIRELRATSNGGPMLPDHTVLNVNYPALARNEVRGVRLANTAYESIYRLAYRETDTPGELRPHSTRLTEVPEDLHGTDVHLLSLGYITIGILDANRDVGDLEQARVSDRLSAILQSNVRR
jgi:5'-nucleotidase